MIQFVSTRGMSAPVSFVEALVRGLAPDGGLYLPERIPRLPEELWQDAGAFDQMAGQALTEFLRGHIDDAAVYTAVSAALDFPVPLQSLSLAGEHTEDLYLLELFHGPTLSFKDFGARTMARLLATRSDVAKEGITVLVATSGDTGSAVADGFSGLPGIRVILLYPRGQVSRLQELQLIAKRPGVRTFAVEGSFDDCQDLVKGAFADLSLRHLQLTSANSINVGRLLPQMSYYLHAVHVLQSPVVFCTPSGNLGNLTAGVLASLAGLPVRRFIAAHNSNSFFPEFLHDSSAAFRRSVRTLSNAMDVGAPSNFERLRRLLPESALTERIEGASIDDEATRACMRRVFEECGQVVDPHTAVGIVAALRYRARHRDDHPVVILSTAHPAKFPETVADAIGIAPPSVARLDDLADTETRVDLLAARPEALRAVLLERDW